MAYHSGKIKPGISNKNRNHPYRISRLPRREVHRIYDKIYATIYGHCIGDAIGLLTEGLNKEEVKKYYKEVYQKLELVHKKIFPDAHRRRWKEADWTDETDQMILIMQSIAHNKCMASEIIWRDSGKFVASNSAVARTAFLGVHQYDNLGQVIKNTLDICRVTHADPRCEASCVAVTTVLALMLQKKEQHMKKSGKYNVDALINDAFAYSSKLLRTEKQIKELKFYLYCESIKDLKLDELGRTSFTYKAVGAGFWALKQKDFRQALQTIVLEGGDADANGAVAGAMLGCKLGLDALPKPWFEPLIHRAWLDELIDRYFDITERKKRERETVV